MLHALCALPSAHSFIHILEVSFTCKGGCNACPACLLAKSDRIGGDRFDLLNSGHAIPLGLSSEFRIPSCARPDGIGIPRENSEMLYVLYPMLSALCSLLFTLYSMRHALCSMRYALCPMRHALCPVHHACRSTGARPFFEQVSRMKALSYSNLYSGRTSELQSGLMPDMLWLLFP